MSIHLLLNLLGFAFSFGFQWCSSTLSAPAGIFRARRRILDDFYPVVLCHSLSYLSRFLSRLIFHRTKRWSDKGKHLGNQTGIFTSAHAAPVLNSAVKLSYRHLSLDETGTWLDLSTSVRGAIYRITGAFSARSTQLYNSGQNVFILLAGNRLDSNDFTQLYSFEMLLPFSFYYKL